VGVDASDTSGSRGASKARSRRMRSSDRLSSDPMLPVDVPRIDAIVA
jgi:hypothetical protein